MKHKMKPYLQVQCKPENSIIKRPKPKCNFLKKNKERDTKNY